MSEFVLVPDRSAVRIAEQEIPLTATEFQILSVLVSAPDVVFSRAEIIAQTMGDDVYEQTVDAHISSLRRKLGPYQSSIQTVRGVGYRYRP
jgi:DNA-binding response OmpR family regulator